MIVFVLFLFAMYGSNTLKSIIFHLPNIFCFFVFCFVCFLFFLFFCFCLCKYDNVGMLMVQRGYTIISRFVFKVALPSDFASHFGYCLVYSLQVLVTLLSGVHSFMWALRI
jgi:hypothetical protein